MSTTLTYGPNATTDTMRETMARALRGYDVTLLIDAPVGYPTIVGTVLGVAPHPDDADRLVLSMTEPVIQEDGKTVTNRMRLLPVDSIRQVIIH